MLEPESLDVLLSELRATLVELDCFSAGLVAKDCGCSPQDYDPFALELDRLTKELQLNSPLTVERHYSAESLPGGIDWDALDGDGYSRRYLVELLSTRQWHDLLESYGVAAEDWHKFRRKLESVWLRFQTPRVHPTRNEDSSAIVQIRDDTGEVIDVASASGIHELVVDKVRCWVRWIDSGTAVRWCGQSNRTREDVLAVEDRHFTSTWQSALQVLSNPQKGIAESIRNNRFGRDDDQLADFVSDEAENKREAVRKQISKIKQRWKESGIEYVIDREGKNPTNNKIRPSRTKLSG